MGTTPEKNERTIMAWVYLFVAGLFEIAWALGLKYSHGLTRLWPSVLTLALMGASFLLLSIAMRQLPLGTAYAVWTGIGAVGTTILGMILLGESASVARLLCITLIVSGIVGLKMAR